MLAGQPDTFVLYRIIGNDLEPRHRKGQSFDNLRFILENEPPFDGCEKCWIVNRIADSEEEARVLSLIGEHGHEVLHLPFETMDYAQVGWDTSLLSDPALLGGAPSKRLDTAVMERLHLALYRHKNAYAMNNNGARNRALANGRGRAKWVLPWDGNCFMTDSAWEALKSAVIARPYLPYFLVPMARVPDNASLLDPGFMPDPVEEPQIVMRADAAEGFDEGFVYGRRPKVELFWRLAIPGEWNRWRDDPWDPPRNPQAAEAGQVGTAGWVARLASGHAALERKDKTSFLDRGAARRQAILATLERLDTRLVPADPDPAGLTCYNSHALAALRDGPTDAPLRRTLIADAEAALELGLFSVADKTTLPPSGNLHDYWHPAPYWWPNPLIPGGLPYVRRDGKRVPGTRMYDPESNRYDRTRLQNLFDNTTALALAHAVTGRVEFATRAAQQIHTWFVSLETRMTPHLRYAQVRRGRNRNEGTGTGIIELKDLYYFLDAVRLTENAGVLSGETGDGLRAWLREYLGWLQSSRQGARELAGRNNHGSYYDLQVAAIAAWLGERAVLRDSLVRAQARIPQQFQRDGRQPEEMRRTTTAHYTCFNLQAWLALARIGRRTGVLSPNPTTDPWNRVVAAVGWVLKHDFAAWPYQQINSFDPERGQPLAAHAQEVGLLPAGAATPDGAGKPRFDPHDGIPPYWQLTRAPGNQVGV
ncbi:MAG: alginate lyase family protein [Qingshengfaniella sp.]